MAPEKPISVTTAGWFDFVNLPAGIKRAWEFGSPACMHGHFCSLVTLHEHQNLLNLLTLLTLSGSTDDAHAGLIRAMTGTIRHREDARERIERSLHQYRRGLSMH
jgi:hypothetical protein